MNIIVIYAVSALAVFLLLTTLFTIRIYGIQRANAQRGDDMFGQMSKVIRNGYLAGDRFFPAFNKNVKALFNYDRRLQSLVIKNTDNSILYYYSSNPDAVQFFPDKNKAEYTTSRNFMLYKGPVKVTATPPVLNIEILYKISDRNQVVYVFKALIVYTLVYIIITAIALVASSTKGLRLRAKTAEAQPAEYYDMTKETEETEKEEAAELEKIEEEEPVHVDFDHKPADFGFADIKFFEIALTDSLTEAMNLKKDLVLAEFKFTSTPSTDLWKLAGEVVCSDR